MQTVTQTEVELPLSRNATEEEARGSIATLEPIEITPTATRLDESFTALPDLFTTALTAETAATEEENVTREDGTAVWTVPEEVTTIDLGTAVTTLAFGTASTAETAEVSSVEEVVGVTATPGLESASAFTVEDQLVRVTAAPGAGHLPEQPISPTGKAPGLREAWRPVHSRGNHSAEIQPEFLPSQRASRSLEVHRPFRGQAESLRHSGAGGERRRLWATLHVLTRAQLGDAWAAVVILCSPISP